VYTPVNPSPSFFSQKIIETPSSSRGSEIVSPWECLPEKICVGKGKHWYIYIPWEFTHD